MIKKWFNSRSRIKKKNWLNLTFSVHHIEIFKWLLPDKDKKWAENLKPMNDTPQAQMGTFIIPYTNFILITFFSHWHHHHHPWLPHPLFATFSHSSYPQNNHHNPKLHHSHPTSTSLLHPPLPSLLSPKKSPTIWNHWLPKMITLLLLLLYQVTCHLWCVPLSRMRIPFSSNRRTMFKWWWVTTSLRRGCWIGSEERWWKLVLSKKPRGEGTLRISRMRRNASHVKLPSVTVEGPSLFTCLSLLSISLSLWILSKSSI